MKKPEPQTVVLVLGLGAAITGCSLLLGADKDFVDLDATGSTSGELTTGTLTTTGATVTGAGGAAMTASSGGMTTGQGGSTGTCGQAGCGGAGSTTATATSAVSSTASSSSTGSGGPTSCGAGAPLSDSFTGSNLDSTKWGPYTEGMGSTVTQTNNQIAVFSTGNAGAFAGIFSKIRFPLQGCSTSLKVLDAPKLPGLTTFFLLSSKVSTEDQVAFTQSGDYLNMEVKDTGGVKGSKQITFVKGKHVYWRFRESSAGGGTIYWETSDTGAVWEEQFTYLTTNLGYPMDQVESNFGVSASGGASVTVHFDSFSLIP